MFYEQPTDEEGEYYFRFFKEEHYPQHDSKYIIQTDTYLFQIKLQKRSSQCQGKPGYLNKPVTKRSLILHPTCCFSGCVCLETNCKINHLLSLESVSKHQRVSELSNLYISGNVLKIFSNAVDCHVRSSYIKKGIISGILSGAVAKRIHGLLFAFPDKI